MYCVSSALDSSSPQNCKEEILGFGNSGLEQPYKKVEVGKEMFKKIVENASTSDQENLVQSLMQFLKCKEK